MKTLTLDIEDSFYPHLKVILDKFIETGQINYIEEEDPNISRLEATITNSIERDKNEKRFKAFDDAMAQSQESNEPLEPEKQFIKLIEELVNEHIGEMADGTKELNKQLNTLTITNDEILQMLNDLSATTNSPAVKEALEFSPQQMKQLHKAIYNPLTKYIDEAKKELTDDLEFGVNHIVKEASKLSQGIANIIGDETKKLSNKLSDISVELKKARSGRTLI